jgi:glucose/arabinose dehydrogenase
MPASSHVAVVPRRSACVHRSGAGDAFGRPVGVAMGKDGALLVADDFGNVIWRVTGAGAKK